MYRRDRHTAKLFYYVVLEWDVEYFVPVMSCDDVKHDNKAD